MPVELEHMTFWALWRCNLYLDKAEKERKFELSKLQELRLGVYYSQSDYKDQTKLIHDKFLLCRSYNEGDRVLIFSSGLKLMP